ncbi:MAG TPA: DUF6259 domain-containing protein [Vicinamibacteria bacterium]|nr:DUF6259 domain-containing protein [Vicinamibacteria bacterium]
MSTSRGRAGVGRRGFLAAAAATAATGGIASVAAVSSSEESVATTRAGPVTVRVEGLRVLVETSTLVAVVDAGRLVSLRSRRTGEELLAGGGGEPALALVYRGGELVPVEAGRFGQVSARSLSATRAELTVAGWDGDGVIAVSGDPETGDLVVEPGAFSSRPGVRACRWTIGGLRPDLELVAPLFQGIRLPLDDRLIRDSHWPWPMHWEAGLAILAGKASGFWVHARDDRYRYKALHVGPGRALGFDAEAWGPIDENRSAGGLAWRINVFDGDWTSPASRYRAWLWGAYGLEARERERREWVGDVRFAVSWCPGEADVLDALAARLPPGRVLLHYPDWRTLPYDEGYPTFVASDEAKAFLFKARSMGFRVMPHFNSVDMDPSQPVYARIRDFQYRDVETKRVQGWGWYEDRVIGVPESNGTRLLHRDKKVMAKIHPGLGLWRSVLGGAVQDAARALGLDAAFLDVTLVSQNLHDCFVEGRTSTEGMLRLIDHVAGLGDGLVVGGEGRNEITAQGLSFAQAHLFRSWQENAEGVERTGGCALGELLFGRLCRTIGYSGLSGRDAKEDLRLRLHEEHGAIPTVTVSSAAEIRQPNPAVGRLLEQAAGRR